MNFDSIDELAMIFCGAIILAIVVGCSIVSFLKGF